MPDNKPIRLISWNVNGLRSVMQKRFSRSLESLDADILAVQETKLQEPQFVGSMKEFKGYQAFASHCTVKKGYSGVAAYTRMNPVEVRHGIGIPRYDDEGRILELVFDEFTVFNVYFPNGKMSPERLAYKLDFYRDFFDHAGRLKSEGRNLVIVGDFNTAHNEIDLKNPKANEKYSGFLRIERDWMDRIIADGFVDVFRHFHPDEVRYSWWSYRFNARAKNIGWRIDYVFVSRSMIDANRIRSAFICDDILGSDHCPVGVEIER